MPTPFQFPVSSETFNELYKAYFVKLCKYAYYLVNSREGAEELVQEFFTVLWHKQNKVHISTSLESYFFRSVKNAAFNLIQKQKREQERLEKIPDPETENKEINRDYFLLKLEEAIAKLPGKTRLVYCLRYKEGLVYSEIAAYLSISERTVETHLYRALKQLKKQLMPYKMAFYNTEVV